MRTIAAGLLMVSLVLGFFIGCGGGGGNSSSKGSGTMPTIDEDLPFIYNVVIKRAERERRYYNVSEAEKNRFLSLLLAAGFTYNVGSTSSTIIYQKDSIHYSDLGSTPIIYDATVGIRSLGAPMGGGYLVILKLENENGDIYAFAKYAFNDIFGTIGGVFSRERAVRTYDGDIRSDFYSYSFDLERNYGFTITPAEPEDREQGNINAKKEDNIAIYLWISSISPAFLKSSVAVWDIAKTGYANL
jgi:hypothetical protein